MRVIVSRRATRRTEEISAYLRTRNPAAARDVRDALEDAFALLAVYPRIGWLIRSNVRRFALTRYPYLIFYAIDEAAETVTIISVLHAARVEKP